MSYLDNQYKLAADGKSKLYTTDRLSLSAIDEIAQGVELIGKHTHEDDVLDWLKGYLDQREWDQVCGEVKDKYL
jgi:hypothetical protein